MVKRIISKNTRARPMLDLLLSPLPIRVDSEKESVTPLYTLSAKRRIQSKETERRDKKTPKRQP
jgi:hypothetical protein